MLCVIYHSKKYEEARGTFQLLPGRLGELGGSQHSDPSICWRLGAQLMDLSLLGPTCAPVCPTSSFLPDLVTGKITNQNKKSLMQNDRQSCHRCACVFYWKLSFPQTHNDCHHPKLHQEVCSWIMSSVFLISSEGNVSLALFRHPRCVAELFRDLPFTYCTCVIKDPIKIT